MCRATEKMRVPTRYHVTKEINAEAVMRDGTILRADVYSPDAPGEFPVILERSPYDKSHPLYDDKGRRVAERGFVFVVQDTRGRCASDGDLKMGFFSSDHMEAEDGYDTVEWCATLPKSNGRVGTTGGSYNGFTQLALAAHRPPHFQAMMPQIACANLLDREMGGVLRLGRVHWWVLNSLAPGQRKRIDSRFGARTQQVQEEVFLGRDRSKWTWFLPLMDIPDEVMPGGLGELWRRWLADHATDHFGFEAIHNEMNVPALTQTGWYDQQVGAIKNFTGLRKNGMTEHARDNQYLIVGPWPHNGETWPSQVGPLDFGPAAHLDYYDICDQWFSRWLKDDEHALDDWPRVRLFIMGRNEWREADDWPVPGTRFTPYYFDTGGGASAIDGDGTLSHEPPSDSSPDEYVYDPRDPVMSIFTMGADHGPFDQRPLDERRDVLRYVTPPFDKAVEVTGPVVVKLFAASTARDTDFTAKLIDAWPDSYAQEVCYGIVRARYRDSYEDWSLIEPGRVYEYTIEMNPTGNLFLRGHRIRVDISSSDFPNFDRNHNTGGNDYAESTLRTARQTVFHDASRPSHIILPLVDKA